MAWTMAALKPIVEAAVLASSQPLTVERLAELFDLDERPSNQEIVTSLHELMEDCGPRGVDLIEVASGFRFQVKRDVYRQVSRLWTERQTRYSRATLETMALIAYRQPITRGEIEAVRGVSVSSQIIRALEEREWIRVIGHRDVPGRPALYGTTKIFLDYFNLKSLDELPTLSEIKDLESMPQFDFSRDTQETRLSNQIATDDNFADDGADDEEHDNVSLDQSAAVLDSAAGVPDLEIKASDAPHSHHEGQGALE